MAPSVAEELRLQARGFQTIAGLDEVGRGCWAGPVVAAAVVLPQSVLDDPSLLRGVNDSKAVSAKNRDAMFEQITSLAVAWGVGAVPAHVIDTHGILNATRLAMQTALLRLPCVPDALLIDAVHLKQWPCEQRVLIRGDSLSLSIAAASIVAKVVRDRMMQELAKHLPVYGFEGHKGYGTAVHERALRMHGFTEQHRRTFRPIADYLLNGEWPTRQRDLS